jgi:hypothetical protein
MFFEGLVLGVFFSGGVEVMCLRGYVRACMSPIFVLIRRQETILMTRTYC